MSLSSVSCFRSNVLDRCGFFVVALAGHNEKHHVETCLVCFAERGFYARLESIFFLFWSFSAREKAPLMSAKEEVKPIGYLKRSLKNYCETGKQESLTQQETLSLKEGITMTTEQALSILAPEMRTLEGIRSAKKAKVKKYHPDVNPNGLEMCKLVNAAFDFLMKNLWWIEEGYKPTDTIDPEYHLDEEIDQAWQAISHLPGIIVTLSGVWIWVVGETKPVKEELKAAGFTWAPKKSAWSWKPAGTKRKFYKKTMGFNEIFEKYGKVDLASSTRSAFAA